MEPIRTSYAAHTLTGEGCHDLPAAAWQDDATGIIQIETAWRPSAEELADLMDGGALYLSTLTRGGFAPVYLSTRTATQGTPEAEAEAARAERRARPAAAHALELVKQAQALELEDIEDQSQRARTAQEQARVLAWLYALFAAENPRAYARRVISQLTRAARNCGVFVPKNKEADG